MIVAVFIGCMLLAIAATHVFIFLIERREYRRRFEMAVRMHKRKMDLLAKSDHAMRVAKEYLAKTETKTKDTGGNT